MKKYNVEIQFDGKYNNQVLVKIDGDEADALKHAKTLVTGMADKSPADVSFGEKITKTTVLPVNEALGYPTFDVWHNNDSMDDRDPQYALISAATAWNENKHNFIPEDPTAEAMIYAHGEMINPYANSDTRSESQLPKA